MHRVRRTRLRAAGAALVLWATLTLAPGTLWGAQGSPGGSPSVPTRQVPDSVALVARIKDAQRRFEILRRRDLPLRLGGFESACDEIVGRMCWRFDHDPHWVPEAESDRVWNARLDLLGTLEEVHPAIPGDAWVLGLRVRYLTEAGFTNLAQRVARDDCLASESWCLALEGYALHRSGWTEEAQEVFEQALGRMTPHEERDWTGLREILGPSRFGWLGDVPDRPARIRLFWALSDPMILVPGNERWVEHMARATEARMSRDARNPHNLPWGKDLEELLIRYGPEVGWEQIPSAPGSALTGGVVGHEDPLGRQFSPPESILERPFVSDPEDWVPRVERPAESYAPPGALHFVQLDHQVGVFWRGDSLRVLAAWAWPHGSAEEARTYDHSWRGPLAQSPLARRGIFALGESAQSWSGVWAVGSQGAAEITVGAEPQVLSIESLEPRLRMAGRVRLGFERRPVPAGLAAISDLVLLRSEGSPPVSLDQAALQMAPSRIVDPGGSMRLAWEIYGLRPDGVGPSYRLTILPVGENFLRRAGRWLRLVGPGRRIQVEWNDLPPPTMGPMLRTLEVELRDLQPGRYRVRLEVALPGRTPLEQAVQITVSDPPADPP